MTIGTIQQPSLVIGAVNINKAKGNPPFRQSSAVAGWLECDWLKKEVEGRRERFSEMERAFLLAGLTLVLMHAEYR